MEIFLIMKIRFILHEQKDQSFGTYAKFSKKLIFLTFQLFTIFHFAGVFLTF